jgi:hypothetical protein
MIVQKTTKKTKRRRVSACNQKLSSGKCSGKYVLTYEENAPMFTCDQCGHKELTWHKFYTEYLDIFREKDNWDVKKHQVTCIIGFFCHMYKEHYGEDYIFVPKNPNPYGSKECRDAWSLLSAFNGDAHRVRKYIYWLFKKQINKNTNITSFGYVNTPGIIRKYILQTKRQNTLSRESKLPSDFINWCNENAEEIFSKYAFETMNDLGALLSYVNTYKDDFNKDTCEYVVLAKAELRGLIKGGKLNIGGDKDA